MSRLQFDIKYRPQIESGEYKVKTRDGRRAKIIYWGLNCTSPIVAVIDEHIDIPGEVVETYTVLGRALSGIESNSDLFLITPEPELTEFEQVLGFAMGFSLSDIEKSGNTVTKIKEVASELLTLAREQFIKDGYVIEKKIFHDATEKVEPEVMNEVSENVDAINNAYERGKADALKNIPNDEDMKAMLQLEYDKGRADVLKDLPRWEKTTDNATFLGMIGGMLYLFHKEYGIKLCDLEKLPGFKEEDGHE